MADVAIVIPCFNEAARLDVGQFQRFLAETRDVRLLFVNDGSTDDTQSIVDELVAGSPERARAIVLERNSGKAEAVRCGMLAALEWEPVYVGFWDADLATPLDVILRFRDQLLQNPQHEIVMGARVRLLGRRIERRALRHYVGRLAATAIAITLGIPVYDTQCGAKLFRASTVPELFGEPFAADWIFDVEILARLIRGRGNLPGPRPEELIYEYALDEWRDVSGSKLGPSAYLRGLLDLLRIYWRYIRPAHATTRSSQPADRERGT